MTMETPPPRVVPRSWAVGFNENPKDGEGPLEVHMTFDMTDEHKEATKAWAQWLMALDPAWNGAP